MVEDLINRLSKVEVSVDHIKEIVSKLQHHILEGNGSPSMLTRIKMIEETSKNSKAAFYAVLSGVFMILSVILPLIFARLTKETTPERQIGTEIRR